MVYPAWCSLESSPHNHTWDSLMSFGRRHPGRHLPGGHVSPAQASIQKQSLTRSVSKVSSISMICWMLLVTVEMTLSMRCTTPLVAWWSAFSSRAQLTVTICQRRSKDERVGQEVSRRRNSGPTARSRMSVENTRACLWLIKSQDRTLESSTPDGPELGSLWTEDGGECWVTGDAPTPLG